MVAPSPDPDPIAEDVSEINQTLADFQSYPVLTRELGNGPGPRTGGASSAAYGHTVQAALQEVLGWRPRQGDAKGFTAALNQSFSSKEVQGHAVWTWTQRTYAIEADLGAVTGAQASIYARAKFALDHSLPLLEGLMPLRSDPDAQDIDAVRAIVRSEFIELVQELGLEGGPRLFRVDELFELLLGDVPRFQDPEQVTGQLGLLRDRFGLHRQKVNTVDEEHNLTNFLIIVDEVNSLRQTWNSQRHYFDRKGSDVFFGTQMVQLSRALAVLSESVQEGYCVMDSVFLGEAERQVTELKISGTSIFLGELLSRVECFAADEGPRLIREGGKDGLTYAFRPTAKRLRNLVQAAADIANQGSHNPTRGFHTARVRRLLEEIVKHLGTVFTLSDQVRRLPSPFPVSIDPDSAPQGERVRVIIEGARFHQGARVRLNRSGPADDRIDAVNVEVISESIIRATLDLEDTPGNSTWTVVVINPDGSSGTLRNAFLIQGAAAQPAPSISSLDPKDGEAGGSANVTITGKDFQPGATSHFGDGVGVLFTFFESDQKLVAAIEIDAAAVPGPRDVTVSNLDDQKSVLDDGFTVAPARMNPPVILDFTPDEGEPGEDLNVTITGKDFQAGATSNFGDGIKVNSTTFVSPEQLKVDISIEGGAEEGGRPITVTNIDRQSSLIRNFRVVVEEISPPEITGISPDRGRRGEIVPEATVTGDNFDEETEVTISDENDEIEVTTVFESETELTLQIEIGEGAELGKHDVIVTNSHDQSATLEDGFTVRRASTNPIDKEKPGHKEKPHPKEE